MGNKSKFTDEIKHIARKYSTLVKITPAKTLSAEILNLYRKQVASVRSRHTYLTRNPHERADIKKFYPHAKSVLMCAFNYWNSKLNNEMLNLSGSRILKLFTLRRQKPLMEYKNNPNRIYKISRYPASNVYQREIEKILKKMLAEFKTVNPQINGKFFVDTSAVMEKPLALRAGLGFRGKNTLVINPEMGSFFFIGGIALNIELETDTAGSFKGCGRCSLCVKSCPTGALSDYKLNVERCITAWNRTETEDVPPFIAQHRKTLALACDVCQQVCPYNKNTDTPIIKELEPIVGELT